MDTVRKILRIEFILMITTLVHHNSAGNYEILNCRQNEYVRYIIKD